MSERTEHERAEALIVAERVEGLGSEQRAWLRAHLDACRACRDAAAALERSVGLLRESAAAPLAATGEWVRSAVVRRARARAERRGRLRLLALSCAAVPLWWASLWAALAAWGVDLLSILRHGDPLVRLGLVWLWSLPGTLTAWLAVWQLLDGRRDDGPVSPEAPGFEEEGG